MFLIMRQCQLVPPYDPGDDASSRGAGPGDGHGDGRHRGGNQDPREVVRPGQVQVHLQKMSRAVNGPFRSCKVPGEGP